MQKLLLAGLLLVFVIIALIVETKSFNGGFTAHGSSVTPTLTPTKQNKITPTSVISFIIKNRKITTDASEIKASRDTEVVLHITGDISELLTIDKYKPSVLLQKGKEMTLSFVTSQIGSFVIRLGGIPVGILTVHP